MFFLPDVLEVPVFLNFLRVAGATVILVICRIVFIEKDPVRLHVLECLVHPATPTFEVLIIAVHQLLNRVGLERAG